MEESGATFGGLRPPSAFGGRDLHYGENPYKLPLGAVPTPPYPEDPGVHAQMLGLENLLQPSYLGSNHRIFLVWRSGDCLN